MGAVLHGFIKYLLEMEQLSFTIHPMNSFFGLNTGVNKLILNQWTNIVLV
jgi:hypothetical protein